MSMIAMVLLYAGFGQGAESVPGMAILAPFGNNAPSGEVAARKFGLEALGGREVAVEAEGKLVIPEELKALWWHCEQGPLPGAMQNPAVKKALLDWVADGHGLFLSGTALAYVQTLGLEPTAPRLSASGGNDNFTAGVSPGIMAKHPIYEGFDEGKPVVLVSAGFPAFADFWGSGGPLGGSVLGEAYPDAGEHPFVEYGHGKGRVVAIGWRLPYYGLADNAHRANLEKLTGNILRYLAKGEWYGIIKDSRYRVLWTNLERINPESVRRAVEDLTNTFPGKYTKGPEYLALLDRLPEVKKALQAEDESALKEAQRLIDQLGEALLANPLLDFGKLLLVKRAEPNLGLPANWQSNSSLAQRGYDDEIAVLSPIRPGGELKTLYRPPNGEFVGDVDLDFDASRMLWSMPGPNGRWQLFEMNADGSDVHQIKTIEEPDVDNYDACYLPDGNLLFTSTADFVGVPCVTGSDHVSNLFRLDRDSGTIRQLGFEQDHDWCPTVLPNGRVLYLRWEYSDTPHFVSRILFAMDPDGTGQGEYYGSNSYWPNAMFYARPIPGDSTKFVAVVGGHHDNPRMGELVLFDADKGKREADGAIQRIPGYGEKVEPTLLDGLTLGSWPKFLHPYPLSDKYFLVACKPTPGSKWGIYLVDVFDNITLVKEVDGYALLEPVPVRATARPPVIPNKVKPDQKEAVLYIADIYQGNGLRGVPRGAVKKLRLLAYHFCYHGMGGQVNRVGIDGPWDVKRIVGTVPVEPDGSAYFRVPANTPLSLQPLDGRGQALQLMRSWMTAMPGEMLSCVGCHEPQSTAPPTMFTAAGRRGPCDITPWYGPTRGFAFIREVQPVLDRHCVRCHNGTPGPDGQTMPDFRDRPPIHPPGPDNGYQQGSIFTPSYLALKEYVRNATIESDMHLLMPGEFAADTTWLMQLLRKGHHGVALEGEAWDRLATWIDLNAPAHGTWHEIVGEEKVNHFRDRRREMMRRYAGRDEDPEEIIPTSYASTGPVPAALPPPKPTEAVAVPGWPFNAAEAQRKQNATGAITRSIDLGDGVSLELVRIPAGGFVMGDPNGYDDESPPTQVKIEKPFWMGKLEVTNAQFARLDPSHDSRHEEGDYLQFSIEERGYPVDGPTQPACRVSWSDATAFCRWLSDATGGRFTLPTEAQWEWACRAGTATPMWWGETTADFAAFANLADVSLRRVDTFAPWALPSGAIYEWRPAVATVNDGHRVSAPVGTYQPNPWGLCDMLGNVAEWTLSTYAPYPYRGDAADDGDKVVRGGSWYDTPNRARSAFRRAYPAYRGVYDVGFRVVGDVE